MTQAFEKTELDAQRRAFLKGGAAVTALAIAPGVMLYTREADAAVTGPVTNAKRWGMLIDTSAPASTWDVAVAACQKEQGWTSTAEHATTDPQWIRTVHVKDKATGAEATLPVMCQHCENPPCVDVCPTGASMQRADGIVLVDKHICIGCRYCMMACPYAARSFVHETVSGQRPHMPRGKGTVEACTMCVHKVDKGEQPACVEAVQATGSGAMMFGDLNDPNSDIAKAVSAHVTRRIRADLGVEPGVHYKGM